jgi:hypothetical protein
MKRTLVLALGLLVAPTLVSAQVEIGLDAGLAISSFSNPEGFTGDIDGVTTFGLPGQWARVAFAAGESILVESLVGFEFLSEGDYSENTILLMPGINYLVGEQFYVRGEVGLIRFSESDTGFSESLTQYGFGGAAGMRIPLGDAALFRLEAGVDRWLEVKEAGFTTALGRTDIRVGAGISAVVN